VIEALHANSQAPNLSHVDIFKARQELLKSSFRRKAFRKNYLVATLYCPPVNLKNLIADLSKYGIEFGRQSPRQLLH